MPGMVRPARLINRYSAPHGAGCYFDLANFLSVVLRVGGADFGRVGGDLSHTARTLAAQPPNLDLRTLDDR